jgi:hypothetical protein
MKLKDFVRDQFKKRLDGREKRSDELFLLVVEVLADPFGYADCRAFQLDDRQRDQG